MEGDQMSKPKITDEMQNLVETELRKGASNSRIANLLELPYKEAVDIIETIKESIRPEIGEEIYFSFRGEPMQGKIIKLLQNSAVILIDWDNSAKEMYDLMEEKTVVNFKDIEGFINKDEPQKVTKESEE